MGGQVRVSEGALELPGGATVRFMRTLRLPETGTHPLPPGLGGFPLRWVADYPDQAPDQWLGHGGVLLPVFQREAVWLSFSASAPVALQVGVGQLCAVSGRPWSDQLAQDPQNYVVLPRQPWLDGINSGRGTIRQLVAVPPEPGTVTAPRGPASEDWVGVQLQVFELRARVRARWQAAQRARAVRGRDVAGWGEVGGARPGRFGPAPGVPLAAEAGPGEPAGPAVTAPGLGAGGRMRQEVYRDPRPLDDWEREPSGRVFVHLATAAQWRRITGEPAPASPVDRAAYASAGLPWFEHYDADAADMAAPDPGRTARLGDGDGQGQAADRER
ncbi:hypothetical protein OG896_38890 [Streptomyces sp. NBC_00669]|uniref:hypothetical protein n=1 Tax=Streptomyces sp. NBC_00669 TaxID=2976011 RepID=UPI002E3110CF|nr:hypothetical protein [Streptomyces sp. NBC_00669]